MAGILSELGARVIDADEVSRFITEPGKPAFERVIREFGSGIVCADGKIDREKLGLAVFSDSEKRRALEAITHPEIRDEIAARTEKASADGAKAVVIEAALLARGGVLGEIIDHLILVNASEVKKIERVAKRDGFDETEAKKRLKSQQGRNPDFDFVIENDGDLKDLRARVEDLWERVVF